VASTLDETDMLLLKSVPKQLSTPTTFQAQSAPSKSSRWQQ